ncbi:MAG: NUDIX domain-containing protein [Candidatus Levybacteria bacterium]|nr:NUDIX domain-containing protein [Candidatus Levybacteria bacterium]
MRFEFSAGGVVFRKSDSGIEVLLCQHSYHHGWGFPKGLIGDKIEGEGKEETAIREVEEETGAIGKIIAALEPVTYWYKFNEEKVKKTVYFYVMEYIEGDITKHDFEMENVSWIEKDKVLEKLTYKSDKEVFGSALSVIMKFANS